MELTDKISYIKGLADGLELDESKDEVKILNQIIELLDDMAHEVEELGELYDDAAERIEDIDEELCDLEDAIVEGYEEDDDECDCCGHQDEENPLYEVTCPECGEKLVVDEDQLLSGEVDCPNCETTLEFDFSDLFDEEHSDECSCGCHADEHYGEDDLMS
jgi:hypothetical protein